MQVAHAIQAPVTPRALPCRRHTAQLSGWPDARLTPAGPFPLCFPQVGFAKTVVNKGALGKFKAALATKRTEEDTGRKRGKGVKRKVEQEMGEFYASVALCASAEKCPPLTRQGDSPA